MPAVSFVYGQHYINKNRTGYEAQEPTENQAVIAYSASATYSVIYPSVS